MDTSEKMIAGETVFHGRLVTVRRDTVAVPGGASAIREIVEHCAGAVILPVDERERCLLVRQFRYAFSRELLEAPAGKVECGEAPEVCAARELSEETGFTADELVYLGSALPSPGYATEVVHVYLALGLHRGACHPDSDEHIRAEWYSLTDAVDMAADGRITDAKTVIALLKAEKYLKKDR